ncbi:Putative Folic acid synthesis protein [Penicillium brasilianum]|uniref:Folic acid synthesis protein FOL1 n=1 Tax=Penicillium brasilianum TaxID=104259 RepID=A0A0F7TRF1_PENBI|nr:Putative Folic acid synthesis protein [Penicillium brasilianum]
MSSVALRLQGTSSYAGSRGISHSWRALRSVSSFPLLPGSPHASTYYARPLDGSCTSRYSTISIVGSRPISMGNPVHVSPRAENVNSKRMNLLSHFKAFARNFSSGTEPRMEPKMNSVQVGSQVHRAFIALGSNVGDRVEMIEKACLEMDKANIKVKRTSSLFETKPMYVLEQDTFINGVCEVETTLEPMELLNTLQSIENALGRKKLIDKGPRSIDLDILLYDQEIFSHERLDVPHKLMLERDFVLRPLCQLIPHERPPQQGKNAQTYSDHLKALPPPEPTPQSTTPISTAFPSLHATDPTRHTHVMAILNLTPDSFSDGGTHSPTDFTQLTETVRKFIASGATIIDIGGESTRPGSVPVGTDGEIARVVPAITHIRTSIPEAANIAISIDTYRARVAEAACAAGADIINDVSAGLLDPEMLPTAARIGKSIILMHMRGTPQTMTKLTEYPDGVITEVAAELRGRIAAAEDAGIRRWRIILDPGLGFAKNQPHDLEILRDLDQLRRVEGLECFPWLMGPSRKRFIGHITGVKTPKERVWGTAATVSASVAGGADIVRVHDVHEMWQVVKVADAIYRV